MSTRVFVSAEVPRILSAAERERIRCAASSGLADAADVLRLLDHVALQERAIIMASHAAESFAADEVLCRVRLAHEASQDRPPIHVRLEFEVSTTELQPDTVAVLLANIQTWTVGELAALTDTAQATYTYRGESKTWETPTP